MNHFIFYLHSLVTYSFKYIMPQYLYSEELYIYFWIKHVLVGLCIGLLRPRIKGRPHTERHKNSAVTKCILSLTLYSTRPQKRGIAIEHDISQMNVYATKRKGEVNKLIRTPIEGIMDG